MKSHFLKKIVSLVLCLAIFICALTSNVFAATKRYVYWFSNANYLMIWDYIPSVVYVYDFRGNSSSSFHSGIDTATSQWNAALGTNMNRYNTSSREDTYIYTIKFYRGNFDELGLLAYFDRDALQASGVAGNTSLYGSLPYTTDTFIAHNNTLTVRKYTSAYACALDLNTAGSNLINDTDYNFVCTHEMGHVLGWVGHSSTGSDVMHQGNPNTDYVLKTQDKKHVTQFYNYGGDLK